MARSSGAGLALALLLIVCATPPGARADDEALRAKARGFRRALVERHLSPEGLVLYRVDLATIVRDLQTGDYPNLADAPTFTGLFAATACTRANVESGAGRAEALADAQRALSGLRFLMDVTGERGLLARAARRAEAPAPDEGDRKWFQGRGRFAGWRWRADVSMDQYANGLLPAVAECHALFPELAAGLVVDFAHHLLAHGLRLVDPDGETTRYGDLSPSSGLGWNSIAQLVAYGGFALAAELGDDPRFAAERDRLRDTELVPFRSRTTNLRVLGITKHSNDLMAFDLYRALVPLARSTRDPALADLRHGLRRAWLRVRGDGNPYFAALLCRLDPPACDARALAEGQDLLERFPADKRKLAPSPELANLPRALLPRSKRSLLARSLVPIELRPVSSFEWKSSPYRMDGGPATNYEYTGLDYLAAYWLYRSLAPTP